MRRWLRRGGRVALALLVLLVALGGWLWLRVRASLPQTSGTVELAGLSAPVSIERDDLGIPVIRAESLEDAIRAHGFVHGQDRFFQMDLTRRSTAGELAAIFGRPAIESDVRRRRDQRRDAARRLLAGLDSSSLALIEAYTEGVNAGLGSLGSKPPEYLLLRVEPEPWRPEDSLLAVLSFFDTLSFNHRMEKPLGVMAATLPAELVDFLTPATSRWDAPLIVGDAGGYLPMPVPSASVVDLRGVEPPALSRDVVRPRGMALGSNNWAVAADSTAAGSAILANDPHLGLRVPHVWHRVQFEIAGRRSVGVGAPGLPGVIIGSNGKLAWGATNSFADQTDFVVVEIDPDDDTRYRVSGGWEPFTYEPETVVVNGGEDVTFDVAKTRWGPLSDEDWLGRPLVVESPAHMAGGLNFDLLELMTADSLEAAVEIVDRWRGPSQNWLLAAADGRIAWVVNGPIPARRGFSGKRPRSWAAGDLGWSGEVSGPRLVDPPSGRLHTANGRTVPQAPEPLTHAWMHSGRSNRIASLLADGEDWDEAGLRRIQLDVRSAYHDFARDLVLGSLAPHEADPILRRFRALAAEWDGRAGVDSAAFVVVARTAEALVDGVLAPLVAPAVAADDGFVYDWALADEPARRILEERPEHLVPPGHEDWDAFLRSTIEGVAGELAAAPGGLARTWGEARPVTIRHPLGRLAILGSYLDMPPRPLPGWAGTVRAQTARYGASMRMVVSPGHEERGLLHMPTGQSGHFMSPHYADQHEAWVEGLPTPLLAGEPVATLSLVPPGR